jgi:hypothetical protein
VCLVTGRKGTESVLMGRSSVVVAVCLDLEHLKIDTDSTEVRTRG